MHNRALQRESAWKAEAASRDALARARKTELAKLTEVNQSLRARVAWLERQVFGVKGEQSRDSDKRPGEGKPSVDASPIPTPHEARR